MCSCKRFDKYHVWAKMDCSTLVVCQEPTRANMIYWLPQIWEKAANCRLYHHITLERYVYLSTSCWANWGPLRPAMVRQKVGVRWPTYPKLSQWPTYPKFGLRAGCFTCSRSVTPWTVMLGRSVATVLRKSLQMSSSCFLIALRMADELMRSKKSKKTCTRIPVFPANPCLHQSQLLGQE